MRPALLLTLTMGLLLLSACGGGTPESATTEDIGEWTDTNYPSYIRRVTHFGQRADWSHDGKRILFLEKTYGDVYEINLETGIITPVTHHYYHNGYTRALYLSNGDILLSGSRTFDPENHSAARHETAELWVLSQTLDRPPVALGEMCSEGPAVSRTQLRIAWAVNDRNTPSLPKDTSQIWWGEIDYSESEPRLIHKKLALDSRKVEYGHNFETQNFIRPEEMSITFAAYGWQGTEVMTLNLETGAVVNMSRAPGQYDEPEGIFPDGRYTLVECDRHQKGKGVSHIDLWKLKLNESGEYERVTWFNEGGTYKASNPVVSDDGRYIAFQVPKVGNIAGVGFGIYIMDLEAAGLR